MIFGRQLETLQSLRAQVRSEWQLHLDVLVSILHFQGHPNMMECSPFPMTATRFPRRSTDLSHQAECMTRPAKSSIPGIFGYLGNFSWPTADTTKRKPIVCVWSLLLCRDVVVQMPGVRSKLHPSTSVSKRMLRYKSYLRATPVKYRWISGCVGHSRDQSGLGAKVSNQVPPMR